MLNSPLSHKGTENELFLQLVLPCKALPSLVTPHELWKGPSIPLQVSPGFSCCWCRLWPISLDTPGGISAEDINSTFMSLMTHGSTSPLQTSLLLLTLWLSLSLTFPHEHSAKPEHHPPGAEPPVPSQPLPTSPAATRPGQCHI